MNETFPETIVSPTLMGKTSSLTESVYCSKMSVLATPQQLHSKLIRAQLPHAKQVQQSPLLKIFDSLSGAATEESLSYCH